MVTAHSGMFYKERASYGRREKVHDMEHKRGGRKKRLVEIGERKREREGRSKLFFSLFLPLDSEQREIVRCRQLHPQSYCSSLYCSWCRSERLIVPYGLCTCQAACTTRPRRRERSFSSYLACSITCS